MPEFLLGSEARGGRGFILYNNIIYIIYIYTFYILLCYAIRSCILYFILLHYTVRCLMLQKHVRC